MVQYNPYNPPHSKMYTITNYARDTIGNRTGIVFQEFRV